MARKIRIDKKRVCVQFVDTDGTICGYYGRACRQMNDKADTFLCTGCALAEFSN